MVILSANS